MTFAGDLVAAPDDRDRQRRDGGLDLERGDSPACVRMSSGEGSSSRVPNSSRICADVSRSRQFGRSRDFILDDAAGRREGVDDRQRIGPLTMPPCAKQRPILNRMTSPGSGSRPEPGAREQEAEIALLVAMQHPVARVGARIERFDQAEIAIDAHQQHGAVDAACALDVGRVMIGRADPRARRRDDRLTAFGLRQRRTDGPRTEAARIRPSARRRLFIK